ncbi:rhodanese-like domain-containing protein [Planctomycetota bacterium]
MHKSKSVWIILLVAALFLPWSCGGCGVGSGHSYPPIKDPANMLWGASILAQQIALGEVIVLDCRKDVADATGAMYTPYDVEHITGSHYIDFFEFGDPYPPDEGSGDFNDLVTYLGNLGITTSSRICLYDAGIANPQGKVFWNLERLGCTDVHILDGGLPAWGGDTSKTATAAPTPVVFTPNINDNSYYQLDDMKAAHDAVAGGDNTIAIIDYREAPLYWGNKICPDAARHGRIPNSELLDWHDYFNEDTGKFLSRARIKTLTEAAGGAADKTNVVLCNKGWRSGIAYYALRRIGYPRENIKHYVGGIREWAGENTITYPMDTEGCFTYDATQKMPPGTSASRRFAGGFAQIGSTVYCAGGYTANTVGGVCNDSMQSYDIAAGTWNALDLSSLPAARAFSVAGTDGTDVWVFGGLDDTGAITDTIYKYNVVGDAWTEEVAVLPTGRWSYASASVGAKIYVGGGLTAKVGSVTANYSADFWAYDTTNGTWDQSLPDLPVDPAEYDHGRRCHSLVADGTDIYLMGGFWWDDTLPSPACKKDMSDLWVFDTTIPANGWTQLTDIPIDVAGHVGVLANGMIYIPGGWTMGGIKFDVYEYNIGTDAWSKKMRAGRSAQIGWPRYWYFIGTWGNDIAVIGGYGGGSGNIATTPNGGMTHFNQVYVYDLTSPFD